MRGLILICAVWALVGWADESVSTMPVSPSEFEQTLDVHLQSISQRDLEGLLSTVTQENKLTLIFPDGTTLFSRQEYVDFHVMWFADDSWKMEIEKVSTSEHENYAVALVRTTYTDEAGPRQAMLALHFVLQDDQWRLVFDQNTRIVNA